MRISSILLVSILFLTACQKDEEIYSIGSLPFDPIINPIIPWANLHSDYHIKSAGVTNITSTSVTIKFVVENAGNIKGSRYHLIINAGCKYYDRIYPDPGLDAGAQKTWTIGLSSALLSKSVHLEVLPVQEDMVEDENGKDNRRHLWGKKCWN